MCIIDAILEMQHHDPAITALFNPFDTLYHHLIKTHTHSEAVGRLRLLAVYLCVEYAYIHFPVCAHVSTSVEAGP